MTELIDYLNDRFKQDDLKEYELLLFTKKIKDKIKLFLQYKNILIEIQNDEHTPLNGRPLSYNDWNKEFKEITELDYSYDNKKDIFYNHDENITEIPLVDIGHNIISKHFNSDYYPEFSFDDQDDYITISFISNQFNFSFINTPEYKALLQNSFLDSLESYANIPYENTEEKLLYMTELRNILLRPTRHTAKFESKTGNTTNIKTIIKKINSCCYFLAIENNIILNTRLVPYPIKIKTKFGNKNSIYFRKTNKTIPNCEYINDLVAFFKSSKLTHTSSQQFLDLYHIFEYLFLRVSEDILYDKVKSFVNHPNFGGDETSLHRVISIIKKNNTENDETEMLKKVISKYVDEDDLIDFLKSIGLDSLIKGKRIFGEEFTISLKNGHATANVAKVLKHVRNALVHSSDKYKREDCHIPFSESEEIVSIFIPVMEFLAEKVIAGTATPL